MLKQAVFSAAQQDLTYLSVVRTDPSQITQILNTSFQEAEKKVTECEVAEKELVKQYFKQYIDQCKQFLFGQINHQVAAEALKKSSASGKGVCAKTLNYGDVAWKCETCEKDPTCIICQECFEKGNHTGHKVWLKRGVSGCCDCGDSSAWDEAGFCSKHKGYSSETLLEQLPPFIKKAAQYITNQVTWQLKLACLKLQRFVDQSNSYKGVSFNKSGPGKQSHIIAILFEFMDWSVDVSPAFIHFWTEALNDSFLKEVKEQSVTLGLKSGQTADTKKQDFKTYHVCCPRTHTTSDEKRKYSQDLQSLILEEDGKDSILLGSDQSDYVLVHNDGSDQKIIQPQEKIFSEKELVEIRKAKGLCTCSPMDLTFQINHALSERVKKMQYELYFKMFQSYKFKEILGLSFAANFEVISLERPQGESSIASIGVQILTIDEISLMIIQDENLRNAIIQTLSKALDNLVEHDFADQDQTIFISILYDLKYMTRQMTLKYAVEQTDLIERMVEQLTKLYYKDKFEFRTEHIMFDVSIYKEGLYNIDIFLLKIYKAYLKALDFTDIPRNRRLIAHFISLFEDLNDKMPDSGKEAFFAVPLHRVFSYYFTRLVMQNYLRDQATYPDKKPKDIFVDIARRFIIAPPGENQLTYIQKVIRWILRPVASSWAFTHEIMSGKWVMSGVYMNQLHRILYAVFSYYVLLEISLFQMLIVISPEPAKTLECLIGAFTTDVWMRTLHTKCFRGELNLKALEKEYDKYRPLFDDAKLRTMINWELRLMIQLSLTELPFVYPLLTNLSRKDTLTYPVQNACNPQIEQIFRNDMRRSIVHALILAGGRKDMKSIKLLLEAQEIYVKSEYFEEELLQVATQHREGTGGKVMFKLKEEAYLQWFEPFFYLLPENQAKQAGILQSTASFADKKLLNEILGDHTGSYPYATGVNDVIQQHALGQSGSLLKFVCSLIVIWATQESQAKFRVVDDQIGGECLKILMLIGKGQGKRPKPEPMFTRCLKENDSLTIMSLKVKWQQAGAGSVMERAIKEVLRIIYELDKAEFALIGEMLGLVMNEAEDLDTPSTLAQSDKSMSASDSTAVDEAQQKKLALQKRKDEILKMYQKKRQGFTDKTQTPSDISGLTQPSLSKQSSSSLAINEDLGAQLVPEDAECSFCREQLSLEHFNENPFGQFAHVSQSKLLYHALRQNLEKAKEGAEASITSDGQMKGSGMTAGWQEEEKKSSLIEEEEKGEEVLPPALNPLEYVSVNCLNAKGTGGTLTKCSHYIHQACLAKHLNSMEGDSKYRDIRKIIGLDFQTFQCPLCKHIANVIMPCGTLSDGQTTLLPKQKAFELIDFQVRLLSNILKYQEGVTSDFLPVDVRKKPEQLLKAIQKFIEHKIQLLDVKGIHDFLKTHRHEGHHKPVEGGQVHSKNRIAKEQYADILEITRNVMNLILSGDIPVSYSAGEDLDMTEHTVPSLCIDAINQVLYANKGWQLLEADFSSLALQLMFYTTLYLGIDDLGRLNKAIDLVANQVFQLFQIQTLLKGLYQRQNSMYLSGKPAELYQLITNRQNLLAMQKGKDYESKQFVEQFIVPSQLAFLRKLASFKVLVHTAHFRSMYSRINKVAMISIEDSIRFEESLSALKKTDDVFINRLTSMYDDNEEYLLLTTFLSIKQEEDIQKPVDLSDIPEDLIDVLNYFSSHEQQDKILESYALSKLMEVLNPELKVGYENIPVIKEQILKSEPAISLPMPSRFILLQSNLRFRLVDLPTDFQTLVQTYYKRKCRGCKKQPKESCVCLLCGEIVCFLQKCCTGNLPGMKPNEGELSYHARTCEGGNCLFISTSNGKIIMIDEERSCQKQSPYMNKFGETFSQKSKKWENFHLQNSSAGGAINQYEELRRMYMNFRISKEVIEDRISQQVVWRLRAV